MANCNVVAVYLPSPCSLLELSGELEELLQGEVWDVSVKAQIAPSGDLVDVLECSGWASVFRLGEHREEGDDARRAELLHKPVTGVLVEEVHVEVEVPVSHVMPRGRGVS